MSGNKVFILGMGIIENREAHNIINSEMKWSLN